MSRGDLDGVMSKIEWFKHYPDPDEARVAAERLTEERG